MDYKKISDFFKFHSKLIKNPICLGWDLIHQEGFEPPTYKVEACYSIQLSYWCKLTNLLYHYSTSFDVLFFKDFISFVNI